MTSPFILAPDTPWSNLRYRAVEWVILRVLRVGDGLFLPLPARVLLWLAFPVWSFRWWAAGVYNPSDDTYCIGGSTGIPGRVLRSLCNGPYPTKWFRVTGVRPVGHGSVWVIETARGEQYPGPADWLGREVAGGPGETEGCQREELEHGRGSGNGPGDRDVGGGVRGGTVADGQGGRGRPPAVRMV